MSNVFKSLQTYLKNKIDVGATLTTVNKDNLIETLNQNIKMLNIVITTINNIITITPRGLMLQYINKVKTQTDIKKTISINVLEIPVAFQKRLRGNAQSFEDRSFLSSIRKTCSILLDANNDILKNIDKLITNKVIVVNTIKVVDVYCIAIIKQSKVYADYAINLIGLISCIIDDSYTSFPKYRQMILINEFDFFIDLTENLCNQKYNVSILKDTNAIQKNGMNFKLYNNNAPNTSIHGIDKSVFSSRAINYLNSFIIFPNPFDFFGSLFVDFKHYLFKKNKDTKEWLEYHIAALKMKQENIDPNDPKYIKVEKAIHFYEEQIAKNQAKIDSYLDEK